MHQALRPQCVSLGVWRERKPLHLEAPGDGDRWALRLRVQAVAARAGFTVGKKKGLNQMAKRNQELALGWVRFEGCGTGVP